MLGRAGALAILDVGHIPEAARTALAALERDSSFTGEYGVRIGATGVLDAPHLPRRVGLVVLPAGMPIASTAMVQLDLSKGRRCAALGTSA